MRHAAAPNADRGTRIPLTLVTFSRPSHAHRPLFSNTPSAFPRLMHINPTMSGPVYLRRSKDSAAPWGVGFAGAEFVVLGKTVVGVEEVWEVVGEVRHGCFFADNFLSTKCLSNHESCLLLFVVLHTAGLMHALARLVMPPPLCSSFAECEFLARSFLPPVFPVLPSFLLSCLPCFHAAGRGFALEQRRR